MERAECPFLHLPVELRLVIYGYVALDSRAITIGTAKLEGSHADIIHRLYSSERGPFAGIPLHHEPVVHAEYTASLLSPTKSAHIYLPPATLRPPGDTCANIQTAYHTLSHLCKKVRHELNTHFAIPSRRETSLFVQYPHGLHILHTLTPQLLRQSRSVHLAGKFLPRNFSRPSAAYMGPHMMPLQDELQGGVIPDSMNQLANLIKSTFGPDPTHKIDRLEMRIYYPDDDSGSECSPNSTVLGVSNCTVWSDNRSPTVIALRNVHLGDVNIETWKGRYGTGAHITIKPTSEKKRVVNTAWRKLEEGRRGQPAIGSWVVDPQWPAWRPDHEINESPKANTVTSVPPN